MDRQYYLDLAAKGLCMPIGADLILHEHEDAEAILLDGERLGEILKETAYHFSTPLAFPHMNLELEKEILLKMIGVASEEMTGFRFATAPDSNMFALVKEKLGELFLPAMQAQIEALRYVAARRELLPVGMSIGPFSLMTKLVADPIIPVCMAGRGVTSDEDAEIRLVEKALDLGLLIILHNIRMQIEAGAKALFIAEPAANKVYFSPNQLKCGSDIFERYVMAYNYQIKALLDFYGVDLIFHCCGELIDYMVEEFVKLDPAILSLGSSRKLWEDAALVPKSTVLFGNLPSKQFYSDSLITVEEVIKYGNELLEKMRQIGHPFILGSECDILSVSGCQETIMRKAEAIQDALLA
ncbi:MAG: uroporphyrinogen decarboxylase family protein [bacterium]|jgi:uroporphyrinogen-III decarboxylase|nr:uroporphyrinogen decarboxylase family protein [bacterium]